MMPIRDLPRIFSAAALVLLAVSLAPAADRRSETKRDAQRASPVLLRLSGSSGASASSDDTVGDDVRRAEEDAALPLEELVDAGLLPIPLSKARTLYGRNARQGDGWRPAPPPPTADRLLERLRGQIVRYRAVHARGEDPLPASLRLVRAALEGRGIDAARRTARLLGVPLVDDQAVVIVHPPEDQEPSEVRARLSGIGASMVGTQGEGVRSISALVPLDGLTRLAADPGLGRIEVRPAVRPDALSEGVAASAADIWQRFAPPGGLPLGRPVRVAVVDAGFLGYESLLNGDLPASVETATFCRLDADPADGVPDGDIHGCDPSAPTPHGAAVAEIVHDMAPEAELLLADIDLNVDATESWQEAMQFARTWGADIISTSLGSPFWTDNRDGSGPMCATARDLARAGTAWVTSAGNEGSPCNHEHYAWASSGKPVGDYPYGDFQAFPKGSFSYLDEFTLLPRMTHFLYLTWNHWGILPPADDYDLAYFCDFGNGYEFVAQSSDRQCGTFGSVPVEALAVENDSDTAYPCAYAVLEYDPLRCPHPVGPKFDVYSFLGDEFDACPDRTGGPYLEEATSAYTISHPADCPDTISVGAVCVQDGALEPFSGQGPTTDLRIAPDFCAPDATSSETYGPASGCWTGFLGTSASAPHLAGALALLYEKVGGSYTLDQCRAILEERAADINGDNTPDNLCGAGSLCMSATGCH